jgi:hypothetical protein
MAVFEYGNYFQYTETGVALTVLGLPQDGASTDLAEIEKARPIDGAHFRPTSFSHCTRPLNLHHLQKADCEKYILADFVCIQS